MIEPESEVALIINPISGAGQAEEAAEVLRRELDRAGYKPTLTRTSGRGRAVELAARAVGRSVGAVIACGGDGTVHETVQVLAGTGVPLAVVPVGRCNDFAEELGLPESPVDIAAALASDRVGPVDLGRVNDRYFCTVACLGFDARVSRCVDQLKGPLCGQPAYLYGVFKTLIGYRCPRIRLVWDDGAYEGPFFLAATANTATYGGGIRMAPRARPDDGLLELCLVDPLGFWRIMSVLPLAVKGGHGDLPEVRFVASHRLTVAADEDLEIWADGEPVSRTPAEFSACPGALSVIGK